MDRPKCQNHQNQAPALPKSLTKVGLAHAATVKSAPCGDEIPLASDVVVASQVGLRAGPDFKWVWHGFLARSQTTLLVSQWKTGKTTLLSLLLKELGRKSEFLGHAIEPTKALVVSEEHPAHWHERIVRLGIGDHVSFLESPVMAVPTPESWRKMIERSGEAVERHGFGLVVIDPLSGFLPAGAESHAAPLSAAIRQLDFLKRRDAAVLLLHHPRKGQVADGQAARGSGALTAEVDITIEMSAYKRGNTDRRRMLHGYSRHAATPKQAAIELSEDGKWYSYLGSIEDASLLEAWPSLERLFANSQTKLLARHVRDRWPLELGDPPDPRTVNRRLESAVQAGRLARIGRGVRNSPFQYFLPTEKQKTDDHEAALEAFLT